ncbi:hypothetical protein BV25DRAFT_1704809 [Artomyces pyxidatus]|uniref:Uncharacterized protein n=1 Tax=Artomyces pyxidatus TaxID=48021 RepID=A0ACB8TBY0_9AGAM|nr:hypothetical protein BV25DRAFT_1704809 [Artomyces pyxidatus]
MLLRWPPRIPTRALRAVLRWPLQFVLPSTPQRARRKICPSLSRTFLQREEVRIPIFPVEADAVRRAPRARPRRPDSGVRSAPEQMISSSPSRRSNVATLPLGSSIRLSVSQPQLSRMRATSNKLFSSHQARTLASSARFRKAPPVFQPLQTPRMRYDTGGVPRPVRRAYQSALLLNALWI